MLCHCESLNQNGLNVSDCGFTCSCKCRPVPLQALNRGKGLLPEPNAMQILTGLNNPATLKMMLASLNPGHKQGAYSYCFSCVSLFLEWVCILIQTMDLIITLLSICRPAGSCTCCTSAGQPCPLCCSYAADAPEPSPTGTVHPSLPPSLITWHCPSCMCYSPHSLLLPSQQALLGNPLLWAHILHNKEYSLLPCVSGSSVWVWGGCVLFKSQTVLLSQINALSPSD